MKAVLPESRVCRALILAGVPQQSRVYVAGPMRGYVRYNYDLFARVTEELRSLFSPINPHEEDKARGFDVMALPLDYNWDLYPIEFDVRTCIQECLDHVLACAAVVALPRWDSSMGAHAEIAVAAWRRIPIIYPEEYL